MSSFKDLRIVDNFYQTSAFFPMPTIMVGTLTDDGKTSFGPYSLCQPYYIAGKEAEWDEYRTRVSSWERDKYIINY